MMPSKSFGRIACAGIIACSACATPPTVIARTAPAPSSTNAPKDPKDLDYPATPREEVREDLQGIVVRDPYRWLERSDDPRVQQWVGEQCALSRKLLDAISIRQDVKDRLGKLLYSGRVEAPKRAGGHDFYMARKPGQEKAALYLRDLKSGDERILIDPNSWAPAEARSLDGFWPAHDGRKVAFQTSAKRTDRGTIEVLDVDSGVVSDRIDGLYDTFPSWSGSGDGFYYRWSPIDKTIPLPDLPGHAEVRFHRLGMAPADDRTIRRHTGDPEIVEYPYAQGDGNWIVLQVDHGFSQRDVLVSNLRATSPGWTSIVAEKNVTGEAVEFRDVLYLKTDEAAPRGRVFSIDLHHPNRSGWKEIIQERSDATLVRIRVVGGRLVLLWRKDDAAEIETSALDGTDRKRVNLPAAGYVASIIGGTQDDRVFATFESYTFPLEVLEIDPVSGVGTVWARAASPINSDDYITEERFFTSPDGTRVPMFLVHRRDVTPSGQVPTIYWGYGGFGVPVKLRYASDMFAWLDEGGVYAEAGIRGGGDYGEDWHRAGQRALKNNSITDYLAGAEALIKWGWTSPARLMAAGASNGGLLVGAAITRRPDLFQAAFVWAPLIDMARYPLFGNGKQYVDEYGSPSDPSDLRNLLSYSPYHNIQDGTRYPSVLVYTTDSDDRTDPMHARKFVAALQAASSGGRVLLSVGKNGGHTGPDGVEARVARYADAYAFGLNAMGLGNRVAPPPPSVH